MRSGAVYHLELAPLVLDGDPIADDRGGEAALRPHGEPLASDHAAGVGDALLELSSVSTRGVFVGTSPSTTSFVVEHERKRVEASRSLVVVLEQQSMRQ